MRATNHEPHNHIEKYASRRPTLLLATVFYLLELLDLADRLEETFGFGPYYETSMRVFLRRVSYSVSCGCQTSRRFLHVM